MQGVGCTPAGRSGPRHRLGRGACSEAGSYLRLIDSCITQLKARGPSRTCNESKEEEGEAPVPLGAVAFLPQKAEVLQGYLAHKKQRPPRTLQSDYAQGPMVVPGKGAV